ncbi:MAG: aminotransferase class IV [Anaerolineales bacterium]
MKIIQAQEKPYRVRLAELPIDSENIFLYHKTTIREMYPSSSNTSFDDVLLYNERGEITEFTIGNVVTEINGQLWTPPISCGLLAGTFRKHLLETEKIKERIIYKEELPQCSKIYLVNSVRKWVEVEF